MKSLKISTITCAAISVLLNFVNFGVDFYEGYNGVKGEYEVYFKLISFETSGWLSVDIIEYATAILFVLSTVVLLLMAILNLSKKLLLIPTISFIIISINNFLVFRFIAIETNFKLNFEMNFEDYAFLIMGILFLTFVLWFSYKKEASSLIITIPCVFIMIVLIAFAVYAFLSEGLLRLATLIRWIFIYLTYILISFRKEENSIEKINQIIME